MNVSRICLASATPLRLEVPNNCPTVLLGTMVSVSIPARLTIRPTLGLLPPWPYLHLAGLPLHVPAPATFLPLRIGCPGGTFLPNAPRPLE